MRALVTGVAGFIGSHLAEELCASGWRVRGVDAFTDYYARADKWQNLAKLSPDDQFELVAGDLNDLDLDALVDDIDVVFHQAAQPGVRLSWDTGFPQYVVNNVQATQRLLEAARRTSIQRFVYASSSSVYGNSPHYPTVESALPQPHSPYGVTKLAGEHLSRLYAANWGVPTTNLRYFTVYGPRQRPDMAMHRFAAAALAGESVPLYGDGRQIRDFTYVGDVVRANICAATTAVEAGTVVNVAGGGSVTVNDLLELLADLTGTHVNVQRLPEQPGDVRETGGSIEEIRRLFGWEPVTSLRRGLSQQVAWHRDRIDRPSAAPIALPDRDVVVDAQRTR